MLRESPLEIMMMILSGEIDVELGASLVTVEEINLFTEMMVDIIGGRMEITESLQ